MPTTFPASSSKAGKADRGPTQVAQTPLEIRARGRQIGPRIKDDIRVRTTRAFGKWASMIRNIVVRIEDVNGPKGGVDTRFAIQILIDGFEPIHVEHDAATLAEAEAATLKSGEQRVKKVLGKLHRAAGRESVRGPSMPASAGPRKARSQNSEKKNDDRATAALEDSATKPSRKSTRGSSNRAKAATAMQHTVQLKANAPQAVASRAAGDGSRARPRITR